MWQKARLKRTTEADGVRMDTEFWVVAVPSISCPYDCEDNHDHSQLGYITNIISPYDGALAGVNARAVELLPEFANDVPMVQWEDFIK